MTNPEPKSTIADRWAQEENLPGTVVARPDSGEEEQSDEPG